MNTPNIGTRDEWMEARVKLLDREKDRGRDEDNLAWTMEWLRRHDAYDD